MPSVERPQRRSGIDWINTYNRNINKVLCLYLGLDRLALRTQRIRALGGKIIPSERTSCREWPGSGLNSREKAGAEGAPFSQGGGENVNIDLPEVAIVGLNRGIWPACRKRSGGNGGNARGGQTSSAIIHLNGGDGEPCSSQREFSSLVFLRTVKSVFERSDSCGPSERR